jgi:hypothetical protein
MIRKTLAALATAATALTGLAAIAGTANATVRHSDYYIHTIGGSWVAEDQLTQDQLTDLAAVCQPVQYALAVDAPNVDVDGQPIGVVGHSHGKFLIAETTATPAQLTVANFDQVGVTVPTFIGPTSYSVTADGYSC